MMLHEPVGYSLTFKCYYHPDRFAPRRCAVCGQLICASCTVLHTSGPVCKLCYVRKVLLEEARTRIRLALAAPPVR